LQIKIYLYYNKIISIFVQEFKFRVYILLPFALRALWSHAHRVGTTFALDWSKAREARARINNLNLT